METADPRLCPGEIGQLTNVEKKIGAAVLEWEKIQGQILIHEMYILDTQDKNDPRETDRILLSHGKLSCFRAKGKAWTFS